MNAIEKVSNNISTTIKVFYKFKETMRVFQSVDQTLTQNSQQIIGKHNTKNHIPLATMFMQTTLILEEKKVDPFFCNSLLEDVSTEWNSFYFNYKKFSFELEHHLEDLDLFFKENNCNIICHLFSKYVQHRSNNIMFEHKTQTFSFESYNGIVNSI